jgi:hypothetical protein
MKAALGSRGWGSLLLLALFLSVLAVAQSESLHRALHADSDDPNHQCAVTQFQSGQVEIVAGLAVPVMAGVVAFVPLPLRAAFVPSLQFYLPPSCGPPALLS